MMWGFLNIKCCVSYLFLVMNYVSMVRRVVGSIPRGELIELFIVTGSTTGMTKVVVRAVLSVGCCIFVLRHIIVIKMCLVCR